MILPFAGPIHRQTGPVAHPSQYGADTRVVFTQSRLRGSGRGKESPAQSATKPFQFKDRRLEDGLGHNANQPGWGQEPVEFGLEALGTQVSDFVLRMRHLDSLGRRVILGSLAPVSFGFGLGWPGEDRRNGRGKDLASLLGFLSENHPPEPGQGGRLLFQRRHDPLQGPQQGFHHLIRRRRQRTAQFTQEFFQLRRAQANYLRGVPFIHGLPGKAARESPAPEAGPKVPWASGGVGGSDGPYPGGWS